MREITGKLSTEDITFLNAQHVQAHEALRTEVRQVSVAGWTFKPDVSVWSAAELVEHVLLVERAMLSSINQHMQDIPGVVLTPSEFTAIQRRLTAVLPNQGKATSPPAMCEFSGLTQQAALSELEVVRKAFAGFLLQHSDLPLKAIIWNHGMFGPLSAFHWLLYIPLHTLRHSGQLGRANLIAQV